MNRIYQGKVTAVEIPFPSSEGSGVGHSKGDQGKPKWKPFDSDAKKNRAQWPSALPVPSKPIGNRSSVIGHSPKALHHQLFQDAVNSEMI